jgi:hypothetical protein
MALMQGRSVCLASISEAGGERSKRLNIQPEVGERIGLLEDALITGDEQVHPMPNRLPGLAFSDAVIAPKDKLELAAPPSSEYMAQLLRVWLPILLEVDQAIRVQHDRGHGPTVLDDQARAAQTVSRAGPAKRAVVGEAGRGPQSSGACRTSRT